ncbi:NUDIX domain-containing protein [Paenibacillus sp. GCM10027626]|uniref:NUDIX domain-containing protein n=1 Tax=Paenibacillus sp. GCM10027626 TaxID=3273411 RepID=UPI00363C6BF9
MEIKTVYKVTAYITRLNNKKQQLLVFKEKGFEHLGLQVPGGTVEENEDLLRAIQREVKEETGISNVSNIILLGEYSYYSEKLKSNVKRYYYQMNATCPDQFTHIVQSNDEDNGWIYDYFWFDIDENPTLFSYLGIHLDKIK